MSHDTSSGRVPPAPQDAQLPAHDERTRDFHLGDILSVTQPYLVSPRKTEGVYDIMNWLTGESLFTHQLLLAHDECRAELLRQHPQLAGVVMEGVTPDNWRERLDAEVGRFGEYLPVSSLPKREAKYNTPIADLVEMLDGNTDKIIVVEP